tara:strand:- start:3725 stop:4516 length:792 start_codon:yes stop_codon:yes gene_type:complete
MSDICISAVIKAFNEEKNIGACIDSLVGWADEIVVVDDASTDNTVLEAKAKGARVVPGNRSTNAPIDTLDITGFLAVKGEWILRIDADERMPSGLKDELKRVASLGDVNGVKFARRNMMFGDWPRHGGWFSPMHLRFFRSDAWDRNWTGQIHSNPQVFGSIATLPATSDLSTLHLDYDNIPQFVQRTLMNYALAEAKERIATGEIVTSVTIIWYPIRKFLGKYFIRQGFRDGFRGLVLAGLLGCYEFLIQANIWDLSRKSGEK